MRTAYVVQPGDQRRRNPEERPRWKLLCTQRVTQVEHEQGDGPSREVPDLLVVVETRFVDLADGELPDNDRSAAAAHHHVLASRFQPPVVLGSNDAHRAAPSLSRFRLVLSSAASPGRVSHAATSATAPGAANIDRSLSIRRWISRDAKSARDRGLSKETSSIWMMRPGAALMTTTRSPRNTASSTSCVMNRVVRPLRALRLASHLGERQVRRLALVQRRRPVDG